MTLSLPRCLQDSPVPPREWLPQPGGSGFAPWHLGHHTSQSVFPWVQSRPEMLASFMSWMKFNRHGLPDFVDALNFEHEHAQGADDSTVLFVDVGGG